ncbi:MAG: acetyltransferase [Candidatus Gottesmanbacteria bacterium GW2011_GWB1_44_11c]|uniref:Acetyltransferase n=1 Tax=Candidatus Gottesmanbacteria bacterium GW2011_GWB1_44_11c TaxID=1618447 RepID=A0A0G1J570_9BACT|nr:MAG: acetyltransferase [Candidatus Gottesmanbacteria bacterium GW2011_GWB1_44_11c]HCM82149.1 UDP-3-O-(3-hydroxymyristoyl)glucosamine N-acyltransferase [Patescibacteria group bacterium]
MNKPTILGNAVRNIKVGKNVAIIQPSNVYDCTLGNNCFVGPFVEIQKGVVIGNNTRIQSHTFICELVTIGNDCFIGHGVMFINDTFRDTNGPAGGDKTKWERSHIGNCVSIGSNATILPVAICDSVIIGAGSVVTKDIKKSGVYAGNPAKHIGDLKKNI